MVEMVGSGNEKEPLLTFAQGEKDPGIGSIKAERRGRGPRRIENSPSGTRKGEEDEHTSLMV